MFVNPLSLVLCNIPETHPSKSLQILKSKARIPSQFPLNTDSLIFFFMQTLRILWTTTLKSKARMPSQFPLNTVC